MQNELCPVCGYDGLEDGPASDEICPCCGTQFAYDDFARSHEELRQRWIKRDGAQWWSRNSPAPPGWSAQLQLRNINVVLQEVVLWADTESGDA